MKILLSRDMRRSEGTGRSKGSRTISWMEYRTLWDSVSIALNFAILPRESRDKSRRPSLLPLPWLPRRSTPGRQIMDAIAVGGRERERQPASSANCLNSSGVIPSSDASVFSSINCLGPCCPIPELGNQPLAFASTGAGRLQPYRTATPSQTSSSRRGPRPLRGKGAAATPPRSLPLPRRLADTKSCSATMRVTARRVRYCVLLE
jgi:hypothetical protein